MEKESINLDELRQLRLQRLSGGSSLLMPGSIPLEGSSSAPTPSALMPMEPTLQPLQGSSSAPTPSTSMPLEPTLPLQTAASLTGPCTASTFKTDVLEALRDIKDVLIDLPKKVATAIASSLNPPVEQVAQAVPVQAVPVQAVPVVAVAEVVAQAEEEVLAEEEDLFLDIDPGTQQFDCCGVCHMPMEQETLVHAYEKCGHYPFCHACTVVVTNAPEPEACPYCKSPGKAIVLHLEE